MQEFSGCVTLHHGDCRDVLKSLPDNSLDSCVTDPPYALVSMVKRFGNADPAKETFAMNKSNSGYMSRGFMGKQWDTGETAFSTEFWAEVFRVLKPGAFVSAFGASRGYHRMACAIEDAGFEIRDSMMWIYGTGFPKSHDVSKGIDKAAGAERDRYERAAFGGTFSDDGGTTYGTALSNKAVTDTAIQWQGWGTALKPAFEPIVLARKPLSEKTVAANVLRWGTGAINIDGCRVSTDDDTRRPCNGISALGQSSGWNDCNVKPGLHGGHALGRWPANVVHDGSEEVIAAFPESEGGAWPAKGIGFGYSGGERKQNGVRTETNDSGSAARFFYSAKASKLDRAGSKHPTVKPIKLMQWLARLITPPGGTILDPFAGSGTTGAAAAAEGFRAILIEREAEYVEDIKRRLAVAEPAQLAMV